MFSKILAVFGWIKAHTFNLIQNGLFLLDTLRGRSDGVPIDQSLQPLSHPKQDVRSASRENLNLAFSL